jgi:hypothetical protein
MAKKKAAKKNAASKKDDMAASAAFTKFLNDYHDKQKKTKNEAIDKIKALMPQLILKSVERVEAEYNGAGDSGDFENIAYFGKKDKALNSAEFEATSQQLIDALWKLLPGGFEINEGGYGKVIVNLEDGEVDIQHNQRVEESIYSEEKFNL